MGFKGDMGVTNAIPYEAPPISPVKPGYDPKTQAVGVGYTPEGLDQNPAYYEVLQVYSVPYCTASYCTVLILYNAALYSHCTLLLYSY
jgi:hypothetical protein